MSLQHKVLRTLKENSEPISGEVLARKFNVSRNSIWKVVQALKKDGYQISAVTNSGYKLTALGNVISGDEVKLGLLPSLQMIPIEVRETVNSTNTVLKEMGEKNIADDMVLIAQEQTAGRGRLGRSFYSPKGTGLYMSILLRPDCLASEALYLTTVAAAAVCKAIEEITEFKPSIKWVNDIYLNGKKICGILSEASINYETNSLNYAVVGIGINVAAPENGFSSELEDIAAAIYSSSPPPGIRAKLAAEILNNFYSYYYKKDKDIHMEYYREHSFLTGYHVTVNRGNIVEKGIVTGIDNEARLLVDLLNGESRCYSAGDVQIDKDFLTENDKMGIE